MHLYGINGEKEILNYFKTVVVQGRTKDMLT